MSFLGSLTKGFIRSAVNQVGRDSGKVISNNIYGDSYSIPEDKSLENLHKEKEYPIIKMIYAILLSGVLPFLGSLIVLCRAIINLQAKQMTLFRLETQAVYSPDRRFSTGRRLNGYRDVKVPIKVAITEPEKRIKTIKGIVYLLISTGFILFYYTFFHQKNIERNTPDDYSNVKDSFYLFKYKVPDSEYIYDIKVKKISIINVKNAITVKEDIYSAGIKKNGYILSITIEIINPYNKEMINIPFPSDIAISSLRHEFFANNTTVKDGTDVIFPVVTGENNRKFKVGQYGSSCENTGSCLHFQPNESKTFKLKFKTPILDEIKYLALLGFELEHQETSILSEKKSLVLDIKQKKIIGEKDL